MRGEHLSSHTVPAFGSSLSITAGLMWRPSHHTDCMLSESLKCEFEKVWRDRVWYISCSCCSGVTIFYKRQTPRLVKQTTPTHGNDFIRGFIYPTRSLLSSSCLHPFTPLLANSLRCLLALCYINKTLGWEEIRCRYGSPGKSVQRALMFW